MAVTPYNQPAIELKARELGAGARSERSARIEGRPPRAVISWAIRPALMAASLEAEREAPELRDEAEHSDVEAAFLNLLARAPASGQESGVCGDHLKIFAL